MSEEAERKRPENMVDLLIETAKAFANGCVPHKEFQRCRQQVIDAMTTPSQAKTREEWEALLDLVSGCYLETKRSADMMDHRAKCENYTENKARVSLAIMSLQASVTKLQAENQELYQSLCSTNTQYGQLEEAEKELRAEVERLGRIKREWDALIEPLLDFGRDNAEHLDLRVGDCIITKALGLMEEKVKRGRR